MKAHHQISQRKKTGILAGTFDPVHEGHVAMVSTAMRRLKLDECYLLVEKKPWTHKQPQSIRHRENMVDICLQYIEGASRMSLSEDRFTLARTLDELTAHLPGRALYFIMGADIFLHMNPRQWPGLDKLKDHRLIVFERGSLNAQDIQAHADKLHMDVVVLPSKYPKHSSTDVRLKINQRTLWLPEGVSRYIKDHGLYGM